ncbi:Glucosamine/galactosamine-6-phosphate isomerase [Trypanosoma melophagium]|uniref:Glucosamine/galactosamine-6-phosphate isomerase n=1 Tax=Trypanosoma melophagium TaxID=715481 RepID=UPI00351A7705|nr:Glucosamine/galactosamine-6-phosphate isomerase [Trypanosoma melophagium]
MTFQPEIVVCETPEELSRVACKTILNIIDKSKREVWPLSLALSGGSTPKMLYKSLHDEHLQLLRDERPLRFFLGDERLVATDAADSNYNMAREVLLRDIPDDLVVPVDVSVLDNTPAKDAEDALKAADAYTKRLSSLLPMYTVQETNTQIPVFDIILLGLGSDGHTASVFPGTEAAEELHRAVTVSFPSPTMNPKVWRVTLTPMAITHARHVIVLATGSEKRWVMNGIMAEKGSSETPVSRFLRSCKGKVTFLLDKEIAKGINL